MAAVDEIDLKPAQAQTANTATAAVAAEMETEAAPAALSHAGAAASHAAASMWVAAPVVSVDAAQWAITGEAAIAARLENVSTENVQAVASTVETDDANAESLTARPGIESV